MERMFKELQLRSLVLCPIGLLNDFRDFCHERGVAICGGGYHYSCNIITGQYVYPL